jgi:hypothetical protein
MPVVNQAMEQSMIHEAQRSRTRYIAELAEISALSTADLIGGAVLTNLELTAFTFLTELGEHDF